MNGSDWSVVLSHWDVTSGTPGNDERQRLCRTRLRAAICPHQIRWPKDALHWRKLHEAADEARERVTRAFAAMDEIDVKTHISRHAKNEQRQMIAVSGRC